MPYANPKSHMIRSIRDAGGTALFVLILEAVDNSFDAEANNVVVVVDADAITIADNGHGIAKDKIEAPITLGDHRPSSGPRLGRFGVGITAQAIKHGDALAVETISTDGNGSITANWAKMLQRGDWYYDEPEWRPALGRPTGTIVTIKRLLKTPKPKDNERAREELAERFYPAIASGRRITLNGMVIPLLAEPLMTDVIEETLIFGDRVATVRAGLLKPNQPDTALRRVHVSYLHRVIKPNCGFGCDGVGGIENMFARVELNDHWRLTQFKDDLDEDESDELEERLAEVLRPILEKCDTRSMTVDLQQTIDMVHNLLGEAAARPRHKKPPGPPSPPGPSKPLRQPPIVSDSEVSRTGPVRKSRPRAKIQIEFPSGREEAEKSGMGIVDRQGRIHRVIMPRENPEIADMLAERDLQKRAQLIHRHVAMLYVESNPEQDFEPFGKLSWLFMSSTKIRSDAASVA